MIKVSIDGNELASMDLLKPKEVLHPEFWQDKTLDPEVSSVLKEIAQNVLDSMEINVEVDDIIITGSIASYNWHKLSDIDLHIIFDFRAINEDFELVKRMLDQSRINWNKTHDIFIKGHEVEIYFQDSNETHKADGVWSVLEEAWNVEPIQKNINLDLKTSEKKAEMIVKSIEHVEELIREDNLPEAFQFASKLKKKISKMRKVGLEREGIFSPENLAFKMLRNSKYLEKLSTLKVSSYDKMMSLHEIYVKDYFKNHTDSEYLEFGEGGSLEDLLNPEKEAPWGEVEKEDE